MSSQGFLRRFTEAYQYYITGPPTNDPVPDPEGGGSESAENGGLRPGWLQTLKDIPLLIAGIGMTGTTAAFSLFSNDENAPLLYK